MATFFKRNERTREVTQDSADYQKTMTAPLNGWYALRPGAMLHGRYVIGQQREGRWNEYYSRTYLSWDQAQQLCVEIQEFAPMDVRCLGEGEVPWIYNNEFAMEGYRSSLELFKKMAGSPSSWCKIEGVEKILDSFEENGTWYIVREYVEGTSLKEYLCNRRVSEFEVGLLMDKLMDIVTQLHDRNIIHKGIDPSTIWVRRVASPLLQDFGNIDFEIEKLNHHSFYDEMPIDVFYSKYTPEFRYREITNVFAPNRRWIDIYSLCALYYKLVTEEEPSLWEKVDWDSVPDLSPSRRMALKKGMCVGDRTWYANIRDFRREFMG